MTQTAMVTAAGSIIRCPLAVRNMATVRVQRSPARRLWYWVEVDNGAIRRLAEGDPINRGPAGRSKAKQSTSWGGLPGLMFLCSSAHGEFNPAGATGLEIKALKVALGLCQSGAIGFTSGQEMPTAPFRPFRWVGIRSTPGIGALRTSALWSAAMWAARGRLRRLGMVVRLSAEHSG